MASTTTLFIRDITERKRAQRALENSSENMRLILETVPGLLYSRLPNGEVEYANQRASKYHGMTQEEIHIGLWVDALHPDEKQVVLDEIAKNFTKGEPYTMEYRRRRHDGVYRWFQTSVQPLKNQKGEVIRWYGVLTDVDDLRRAEESLRLAQEKLSHAMQIGVLSEFAASVVHEISQPLTAMVADGEACRLWLSLNSPNVADSRAVIERIVGDGEEVRKIIGTLRDLFRRAPVQKVAVNLRQIVNEVITLARIRANTQQVVIDSQMPDDLPAVMADRIQVQQVLMNLLLNAMDSMQTVSLDRKRIVIRATRHGEMVVTEIEDLGSGSTTARGYLSPSLQRRHAEWAWDFPSVAPSSRLTKANCGANREWFGEPSFPLLSRCSRTVQVECGAIHYLFGRR
jgi:PAS domain S-box-containing protein